MSWYYSDNGKQIGPVSDNAWEALKNSGQLTPATLVWREGMEAWQPYGTVSPAGIAAVPGQVACSLCHKSFPPDEVITMDGRNVCASCKPMAVQLVKEGGSLPGALVYGNFGIRLGAKIIDSIVLMIPNFGVGFLVGIIIKQDPSAQGPAALVLPILIVGLQMAIQAAYSIYFTGKMGATLGKLACGLRVVRPDGSPLTYGRATGRYFAELLNAFTFGIGYIIAGFDDQRRALHDRVADTRVVKK